MTVIREATPEDWPGIWAVVEPIVRAADTFTYDPRLTEPVGRDLWMTGRVTVAQGDVDIAGTANMYANRAGGGAHVSSASFMVHPDHHGQGIGRALVTALTREADARGDKLTLHVEPNNVPAHSLYRSLGFELAEDRGIYHFLERAPLS